jgi:hypothetical protein
MSDILRVLLSDMWHHVFYRTLPRFQRKTLHYLNILCRRVNSAGCLFLVSPIHERWRWRMPSSGMLRRVALVRTDVSEEPIVSIIRVTRIGEVSHLIFLRSVRRLLLKANVVPSSQLPVTLMMETLVSSETSVPTRAAQRNIPEDGIFHSHCWRENLKSYIWWWR